MIELQPIKDYDICLLEKWLYMPHIKKWFHETKNWLYEVEKRNSEFKWIHHFIVTYENNPIGFCQYYEYCNSGEDWHGKITISGAYSIDYLIGETEYIGKGLGKDVVRALIERIKLCKNAEKVIVQPEQDNTASCSLLAACGFVFDKENQVYIYAL